MSAQGHWLAEVKRRRQHKDPGSSSQLGSALAAETCFQTTKCRLYAKSFGKSGQRNVAAENFSFSRNRAFLLAWF